MDRLHARVVRNNVVVLVNSFNVVYIEPTTEDGDVCFIIAMVAVLIVAWVFTAVVIIGVTVFNAPFRVVLNEFLVVILVDVDDGSSVAIVVDDTLYLCTCQCCSFC